MPVVPFGGGATFELEGGHIDAGMYAYTLNVADGNGQLLVSLGGSGALSNAGGIISARYNTCAIGGSLEAGKKIDFGKGWFFEPQIQGAFTVLSGKEYSVSNGMEVELRWGTTGQGRVGFLFGRGFTSTTSWRAPATTTNPGASTSASGTCGEREPLRAKAANASRTIMA